MLGFPRWMGYVLFCVFRDRLLPTLCVVTETAEAVPPISAKALSDALAALGAYAEPPTDAQLAAAERAEGRAGLAARLANALYGSALAHVMTAEVVAEQADRVAVLREQRVTLCRRSQTTSAAGPDSRALSLVGYATRAYAHALSRSLGEQFGLVHNEFDRSWLLVGRVAVAGKQAADGGAHPGAYMFFLAPVDSGVAAHRVDEFAGDLLQQPGP